MRRAVAVRPGHEAREARRALARSTGTKLAASARRAPPRRGRAVARPPARPGPAGRRGGSRSGRPAAPGRRAPASRRCGPTRWCGLEELAARGHAREEIGDLDRVPTGPAAARSSTTSPPRSGSRRPPPPRPARVRRRSFETEAIAGSASPRKP